MYNNNPYMNNRSYQQYYPQYPQNNYMPQTSYQPVMQQPMQEPQIQGIKFLNAEQIKAYIVMPNTKEVLVDNENGLAYVVSADNMGVSSAKKFSFKDLSEPKTEEKQPEIDMSQYVKISDLDKFAQKTDLDGLLRQDSIKTLEGKLALLERQLNAKKEYKETNTQAQ
jgi:hypothetical protein